MVAGETVCKLTDNIGSECEAAGRVEGKVVDYGWLEKDAKEDCCYFHCRSYNHVHNILSFFKNWYIQFTSRVAERLKTYDLRKY